MQYTDAHIHIADIAFWQPVEGSPVCSCAHAPDEFALVEDAARSYRGCVVPAYGVHPQNPDGAYLPFLERLLQEDRISAVGEAGFDLYAPEFAVRLDAQREVFSAQLELAIRYEKPLVIHCRRALDLLFREAPLLAKLPAVVFHSFAGSPVEAQGFLKRRVNAYFSFGKPILNGNKRAVKCVCELPENRLLAETDAPYQTLKGERETLPRDIVRVYEEFARLRNVPAADSAETIALNFHRVFGSPDSPRIPL